MMRASSLSLCARLCGVRFIRLILMALVDCFSWAPNGVTRGVRCDDVVDLRRTRQQHCNHRICRARGLITCRAISGPGCAAFRCSAGAKGQIWHISGLGVTLQKIWGPQIMWLNPDCVQLTFSGTTAHRRGLTGRIDGFPHKAGIQMRSYVGQECSICNAYFGDY
jgi:hypothetical protein